MDKIPLVLVLGFLGSGKTSFIKNQLIADVRDMKPAIIQNEFAPAAIDAVELRHENGNIEILEVNGGSVFCVCRIDNFIPALADFIAKANPGILILEASGISDPLSLAEIITAPELAKKIYYYGSVCLADSRNFATLQKINERVKDQVRMADLVLLNRADQASPSEIRASANIVRQLNPACEIRQTIYGRTDTMIGLWQKADNFYLANRKPPSESPGLKTAVIRSVRKISSERLNNFLQKVLCQTLRLKGFVNMEDGHTIMVQATGNDMTLTDYPGYNGPTQLIAIGDDLDAREFSRAFREA